MNKETYDISRYNYIKQLCEQALKTKIGERSTINHEIKIYAEQNSDFYKRKNIY